MAKRTVFVSSISPHTPRHETPTATTNGGRDEANEKTRRTGNDRRHETETQDRPVPTHRKTRRTRRHGGTIQDEDDARAGTI